MGKAAQDLDRWPPGTQRHEAHPDNILQVGHPCLIAEGSILAQHSDLENPPGDLKLHLLAVPLPFSDSVIQALQSQVKDFTGYDYLFSLRR